VRASSCCPPTASRAAQMGRNMADDTRRPAAARAGYAQARAPAPWVADIWQG
jgi:NTE family protein